MNAITLGHPEAHEKITARLFWKLATDSGYNDAGNIREFVDATTRSLVTRARAEDGARHVNDEQVDLNHEAYTFLCDERVPEQEKLISLASHNANVSQALTEGTTATITDIELGKWYAIGAYNIANVSVSGSTSGIADEGTDYELDKENGRIKVMPAAPGLVAGESLVLTFDQPAIDMESYTTQQTALFYCNIIIEEHNQHSEMWLRRRSCTAYLNVTEWPSQTGEFGTYRIKATPASAVTILRRPEAQTLPTHSEDSPEGAGLSSSSSSTSSASSSLSSSS